MEAFWYALPPTIAAVAGLIVGIINSRKSGEIHTLVNSQLSNVKADLEIANSRIVAMQAIIEGMQSQHRHGKASEPT